VFTSHLDDKPGKLEEILCRIVQIPVQPREFVVLAIGVVIPLLGVVDFIAVKQHGHALREQESGKKVPLLTGSKQENPRIVCRPLCTAIPAVVVIRPIPVALAVGLIVFVIVTNEIS